MKLLPCNAAGSSWEDDAWYDRPGYPPLDGCWIHPPCGDSRLPEVYFCEDCEKTRNEPPPIMYVGSGADTHVQLDASFPERLCRIVRTRQRWSLEALTPRWQVQVQSSGTNATCDTLDVGRPRGLQHGDVISLSTPPTAQVSYSFHLEVPELPEASFPNRYPARFPCRSSLPEAPEAPEELRRLAWQTDQMRRRSEQDQVRVADWSNFSQYVKQHYLDHGIHCTSWKISGRGKPCDPKPASFQPRPLPKWICELLAEAPARGGPRELPYASCLAASGSPIREQQPQLQKVAVDVCRDGTIGGYRATDAGDLGAASEAVPLPSQPEEVVLEETNPLLLQPIQDWLESVDDAGFLLQYYDQIVANFDSLKQIHDVYFHDGCLDGKFFLAAGVTKLGHKRILQKWFRDHFP